MTEETRKTAQEAQTHRATFAEIQAKNDIPQVEVSVPEWGEGATVLIRGLTRGELLACNEDGVDVEEVNARSFHYGLVDPAVTLEEAREILATKSMGATAKISQAITEASGLGAGFQPSPEA